MAELSLDAPAVMLWKVNARTKMTAVPLDTDGAVGTRDSREDRRDRFAFHVEEYLAMHSEWGIPQTCLSCPPRDRGRMDARHAAVLGYEYESAACYACHPRGKASLAVIVAVALPSDGAWPV